MSPGARRLIFLFSIFLNIGFLIIAGIGYYSHGKIDKKYRGPFMHHVAIFEDLDLSGDQRAKVNDLVNAYAGRMEEHRKLFFENKLAMMVLLGSTGNLDETGVEEILAKSRKLEVEKEEAVVSHLIKVRNELTPEQNAAFFGEIADRFKRYSKRSQSSR